MKMRGNICCCLVAFVLICNVTAAIIHKTLEEKNSVRLSCPHSVEGKVTWSRERDGTKVDILTADGGREIRHNDPGRRYSSEADKYKSLYIGRVTISDTGRYLCNNEPAVELTVIPSGTTRRDAAERTTITLKCPPDVGGSDVPTWSRDTVEIQQQRRFHVSPADNTLIITDLQPADSGLYYCDGKPAAYLTVSKDETSERESKNNTTTNTTKKKKTPSTSTTTTTSTTTITTTTKQTPSTPTLTTTQSAPESRGLVLGIVVTFLLLLLLVIIIIVYCTRRCRFKRQGTEESFPVYEDIQNRSVFQSTNGGSTNDPTYSTITDLPPVGKKDIFT